MYLHQHILSYSHICSHNRFNIFPMFCLQSLWHYCLWTNSSCLFCVTSIFPSLFSRWKLTVCFHWTPSRKSRTSFQSPLFIPRKIWGSFLFLSSISKAFTYSLAIWYLSWFLPPILTLFKATLLFFILRFLDSLTCFTNYHTSFLLSVRLPLW